MASRIVTPRIRCARCLPVIRHRCHVICLHVAFFHVIICISSACFSKLASVRVPQFSLLSILSPTTLARARRPYQTLLREREKNILGMDQDLLSGLGISPVDRPSNFVPFWGRLMPQRLTELTEAPLFVQPITPSPQPTSPSKPPPCSRSSDHDRVGENRTSFGLS